MSSHVCNILASGMQESETKEITLELPSDILEICIKYLHYKMIYKDLPGRRPNFDLAPNVALKVLEAAIYLQC